MVKLSLSPALYRIILRSLTAADRQILSTSGSTKQHLEALKTLILGGPSSLLQRHDNQALWSSREIVAIGRAMASSIADFPAPNESETTTHPRCAQGGNNYNFKSLTCMASRIRSQVQRSAVRRYRPPSLPAHAPSPAPPTPAAVHIPHPTVSVMQGQFRVYAPALTQRSASLRSIHVLKPARPQPGLAVEEALPATMGTRRAFETQADTEQCLLDLVAASAKLQQASAAAAVLKSQLFEAQTLPAAAADPKRPTCEEPEPVDYLDAALVFDRTLFGKSSGCDLLWEVSSEWLTDADLEPGDSKLRAVFGSQVQPAMLLDFEAFLKGWSGGAVDALRTFCFGPTEGAQDGGVLWSDDEHTTNSLKSTAGPKSQVHRLEGAVASDGRALCVSPFAASSTQTLLTGLGIPLASAAVASKLATMAGLEAHILWLGGPVVMAQPRGRATEAVYLDMLGRGVALKLAECCERSGSSEVHTPMQLIQATALDKHRFLRMYRAGVASMSRQSELMARGGHVAVPSHHRYAEAVLNLADDRAGGV